MHDSWAGSNVIRMSGTQKNVNCLVHGVSYYIYNFEDMNSEISLHC